MPNLRATNIRIWRDTACILVGCAWALLFGVSGAHSQTGGAPQAAPRASGSSCESIPIDSINDANSLSRVLQSRIAGLSIVSASGHFGSGTGVRMRGNASVSASNEPLIVVDDVPIRSVETASVTRFADATRTLNPLDFVDPADVVRIEVLRGPAATTLYGMQAANGAIRIYTKRGEKRGGARTATRVRCPN